MKRCCWVVAEQDDAARQARVIQNLEAKKFVDGGQRNRARGGRGVREPEIRGQGEHLAGPGVQPTSAAQEILDDDARRRG